MSEHENAPVPAEGHTGRGCLAGRSGTPEIAQLTERRQPQDWRIVLPSGEAQTISIGGRPGWLLSLLAGAGARGLTARDLPAGLRVSGYVHRLRQAGVPVVTTHRTHGGPFPGHHAVYRLEGSASLVEGGDA